MKKILKTLLIASAFTLPVAAYAGHHEEKHGDHQHHETMHQHDAVMGKGTIHSISQMNRKVNITHNPIPALKWPEMTMDLDVADSVDLKTVKPGDVVNFHIVLGEDKVYRITKIMKTHKGEHDAKQCMQGEDCPMHEGMKHPGKDGGMKDMMHNKKDDHGDHKH